MPVTRGATVSTNPITALTSDATFSHTVDTGTTLLLVEIGHNAGGFELSAVPQFNGVNLTLIHDVGAGAGSDVRVYLYGMVSPAVVTADVAITFTAANNPIWASAVNYLGTVTSSVAAAALFLSEDNNTVGTPTSVHESGGSAGNALIYYGQFHGADGTPASNASGFTEVFDTETGGGSNADDDAVNMAELLDAAPAAITVTWSSTDENASIYIELVAAAAGGILMPASHDIQMGVF